MGIRLNSRSWIIASVAVAAVAFVAERLLEPGAGGSLLITMTVFLGLAEGATVLMAGSEISDGHWHRPLLPQVAALHAVIPAAMLLFVVNLPQLSIYPWIEDKGIWFNRPFFIARHLIMMGLVYAVARIFVTRALRGAGSTRFWGVVLVILFVWHLSLIGIEWFMSIEKPWFSTLFGAFVMVSAFVSGICACALILIGWRNRTDAAAKLIRKSIGGLIFGFTTFWAYFYFSQLIVIWYGNIPEETDYLAERIGYHTPYWLVARLIFGMIWVAPFAVLLNRNNKSRTWVTAPVAVCILTGVTLLYWLMLVPVVPVDPVLLAIEMAAMGLLTVSVVRSRESLLPATAGPAAGRVLAAESH